jgi:hypothetical protein
MPKKTTPTKKATPVPEEQWTMPVTFSPSGALVSLRDFTQSRVPALSLSQLTPEQRVELTSRRIELQPRFEVAMVGAGTVDKERALAEVRAQSEVGQLLIEIEQRLISNLIDLANRKE